MARPRLGSDVGGFGQVPLWVIQRAPGSAVRVFGWLSGRYADRDKIAPSRKTLAAELGFTDIKAITDAVATLESIGALVRIEQPGHPTELQLCYSKPENRGVNPSEKAEGGSTEKRTPPFRKNGRHNQESFQESLQESGVPLKKAKKTRKHLPHIYCGDHFCVEYEKHDRFERRLVAAGIDKADVDLKAMYATWDRAFREAGTTDHPALWLEKQFAAALKAEHGEV